MKNGRLRKAGWGRGARMVLGSALKLIESNTSGTSQGLSLPQADHYSPNFRVSSYSERCLFKFHGPWEVVWCGYAYKGLKCTQNASRQEQWVNFVWRMTSCRLISSPASLQCFILNLLLVFYDISMNRITSLCSFFALSCWPMIKIIAGSKPVWSCDNLQGGN